MLVVIQNLGFILTILTLVFIILFFQLVFRMKGRNQIHYAFLVLLTTVFLWSAGAAILEYDSLMGHEIKIWAVDLAYIGLILTPVAVFFLGLIFARTKISFSWKYALLLIVPVTSLVMLFTNPLHKLFYQYISYETLTDFASLGSYFLIHSVYSYILLSVGMAYLVIFSIKNAGFFSRQSIFILMAILISTGYNFLLTIQVIDVEFHTNVITFFVSFILLYLAILKFDFLNVVPIALQKVVDHISDSFLVVDKDNFIIDYNKTFTDTFGGILNISRKKRLDDLTGEQNVNHEISELMTIFGETVALRAQSNFEKRIMIGNTVKYFMIEITPLYNQKIYLSSIILLKDISEEKRALETIQNNYEILMEKERLASLGQLIGGIAHNLKTPIMSISGGIEGLRDLIDEYESSIGDSTVTSEDHYEIVKEMNEWISKIKPHCSYMSDIISTVKGQAAQFNTATDNTFTLDELTKRVELLMKHELKRYHCLLNFIDQTDKLIEMKGDVNSLVQIFDNLIINSIHAYEGKQGTIEIIIREDGTNVAFDLKDYGKGIPSSIQEKLFKEMVTTKGKQGTGLGLYMSYATIKGRFGGNMWFESEKDVGTTFHISLPYLRAFKKPALIEPARGDTEFVKI